jgi:hypothetical protein
MTRLCVILLLWLLSSAAPIIAAPAQQETGCAAQSSVIDGVVNLRDGPGYDFAPFSAIAGDGRVAVLARTDNDWVQVRQEVIDNEFVGFMPLEKLTLSGNCDDLPVVAPRSIDPEQASAPEILPTPTATPVFTETAAPTEHPMPTITPITVTPATLDESPADSSNNAEICTVAVQSGVAPLRNGPGDEYAFYTELQPDTTYIGITRSDNDWIELGTINQAAQLVGWAAPETVVTSGGCAELPLILSSEYDVESWYPDR